MQKENVSKPYDPRDQTQSLFNNPEMSDVRFLVDGQTVYGHKQVLGMGSPVFKSMFFGELKEKREVIEIKDLTPVGFMNALRYIYGYPIDYELFGLYDSYMAGDKYLLHGFNRTFFDYVKSKLTAESSCLIYDQLLKIGEREEISLASVRAWIIENSQEMIQSDHFKQIDQETLISLLSLDELRIAEIDLLAAVSKWVDCELQRQGLPVNRENRRKAFEPIKGYVLFTALTPDQIANCKEIAELLTSEERGSLALHVLGKSNPENPSLVEIKTARKVGSSICSVFVEDSQLFTGVTDFEYSESTHLSATQRVSIRTIYTTYSEGAQNVYFKLLDSEGLVDLGVKTKQFVKDGKWCFSFESPFVMEPFVWYTLKVYADGRMTAEDSLIRQVGKLWYKKSVMFHFVDTKGSLYHCIRGLDFCMEDA